MAKSKLTEAMEKISKKHGENAVAFYKDLDKVKVDRISTGLPSLDYILGGGIPEGRILEIFGPNSSGKTTLAIKFLAEVQKRYPAFKVAFIDVEHALDPEYAQTLGLDMDEVILAQPSSGEEALSIMRGLAESGEVKAIILDSVAKLTPKRELEGEIGDAEMAGRARLMGQSLRLITPVADKNRCTCIFINQTRSNVGQTYGNPETRPGGQALPFDASVIIRTSSKKIDEETGETTMSIVKNKVGRPFRKTTVRITYGKGFDVVQDIITSAKTLGVISRSGAFYSFGKKKWQGEEAMRKEIASDEKLQGEMKEELMKNIGNEPVIVPASELDE